MRSTMDGAELLNTKLDFSDDIFLKNSIQKKRLTRAHKIEGRLQHAIEEKEKNEGREWVLNISQEELRCLQEKDKTLQDLDKGP